MVELTYIRTLMSVLRDRWDDLKHDERGEITEKVIIVAVFAALAIAAGAIIVSKVTEKAESIKTT